MTKSNTYKKHILDEKKLFVTAKYEQDPDPHQFGSLDPDPHWGKKLDRWIRIHTETNADPWHVHLASSSCVRKDSHK